MTNAKTRLERLERQTKPQVGEQVERKEIGQAFQNVYGGEYRAFRLAAGAWEKMKSELARIYGKD